MSAERMQILQMIQEGKISTDEAMHLLEALNGAEPSPEAEWEEVEPEPTTAPMDPPGLGKVWLYPTIAGAVVMAVGAPLMALGFTGGSPLFWAILCGWVPFFVGLFILTLGAWSRSARWFHLRISNARSGERTFALSLPLPLTLSAWVLRVARPHVPQLQETGVDEAILALREGLGDGAQDEPFYIDVHDDDEGEHVQIYIG